jgi:hypothetical protein
MPDQQALKNECIQLWRSGVKPRTITSAGLSMHPLIVEGSILTFLPISCGRSIAVGDIALFERTNMLVAHRIVGRFFQNGTLWLREKGDNTFLPGCFPADCLIGRVVKIDNNGHVNDLTALRQRCAARLIGMYWSMLFALLRGVVVLKHKVCGSWKNQHLRTCVLNATRFLSRLPNRFIKR